MLFPSRVASPGSSHQQTPLSPLNLTVGVAESLARGRWASLHTAGRSWVSFAKEKEQFAEGIVREPDFVFFSEFWQPSLLWFSVRCHSLLYFLLAINEE